jgi:hypothetical protein
MFNSLSEYFPKSTDKIISPVLSKSYRYVIMLNNVTVTISVINNIINNINNNNNKKLLVIVTVTISRLLSLRYLFRKLIIRYEYIQ